MSRPEGLARVFHPPGDPEQQGAGAVKPGDRGVGRDRGIEKFERGLEFPLSEGDGSPEILRFAVSGIEGLDPIQHALGLSNPAFDIVVEGPFE